MLDYDCEYEYDCKDDFSDEAYDSLKDEALIINDQKKADDFIKSYPTMANFIDPKFRQKGKKDEY
jgi:hypothetical protein